MDEDQEVCEAVSKRHKVTCSLSPHAIPWVSHWARVDPYVTVSWVDSDELVR